jgi:hypothetical protein
VRISFRDKLSPSFGELVEIRGDRLDDVAQLQIAQPLAGKGRSGCTRPPWVRNQRK